MTTMHTTSRKRASMLPSGIQVQCTPRNSRMSMGMGGGATTMRGTNVLRQFTGPVMPVGEASRVSKDAVETVKGMRGKEKKDLCDLNCRLAELLERTRFLETTNKALFTQLEQLKKMKGITGERLKEEFEEELRECRAAVDEATKQLTPLQTAKLELEDKVETCEAEIEDLEKCRDDLLHKIEQLNQMLGDMEGENAALRRNIDHAQTERDIFKKDVASLRDDNSRLREDLAAARGKQIDAENERDACAEELQFIIDTTDVEITELRDCIKKMQELTPKMEIMYKSGMKDVMEELQNHFQTQVEEMKNELQSRYEEKIQSMQANMRRDATDNGVKKENKILKSQYNDSKRNLESLQQENARLNDLISQLRKEKEMEDEEHDKEVMELTTRTQELEADLADIRLLMDDLKGSKLDLELEICCYRKLLDGEENKMKMHLEDEANVQSPGAASLSSMITGGGSAGSAGQSSQQSSS